MNFSDAQFGVCRDYMRGYGLYRYNVFNVEVYTAV